MFSAILILGVTALCVPLPATRLRCEGSSWGDNHPSYSYAIRHDRELTFTWSPEHTQERVKQQSYVLKISDNIREVVYDSGIIKSSIPVHTTVVSNLKSGMTYEWELMWSDGVEFSNKAIGQFHTGLSDVDWTGVPWIGSNDTNLFRGMFSLESTDNVILSISGLGYSSVEINGKIVSGYLVTSPWNENERTNMFSTFDISSAVVAGKNVIGVALGYGWRDRSRFPPKDSIKGDNTERVLRAIIAQDSKNIFTSANSWTTSQGPVSADSVYDGETHDSRNEKSGWSTPQFVPGNDWKTASVISSPPSGRMLPWSAPRVSISREVKPINITQPHPGIYVVDFGVNLAGGIRLSNISIPEGANVTLKFAEVLQHANIPGITVDPGMIYTGNLRGAKATDVYISNGKVGSFQPRFTYHGFRYVQVTGMVPLMNNIEMLHFHSAVPMKTITKFSSPILNAIQRLAVGAQRSNMMSVLTDCDQRDERLGWMGDAALSADSISFNFDAASFFKTMSIIHRASLNSDGSLPDVVPFYRYGGRPGDVSWTMAYPQVVYINWKTNGDIATVKEHLSTMIAHQKNIVAQAKSAGSMGNMHTSYGDWVPPPHTKGDSKTSVKPTRSYTTASSYLMITRMVSEMAFASGNTSIGQDMAAQYKELQKEFNAAFLKNGLYDKNIQTDNTLALANGVTGNQSRAATELYKSVKDNGHHFYSGIIGFKFLFDGLHNAGHADDALAVLEATDYPSIGYMITNTMEPATENTWELIDGPYEGPGMNSRDHHMWTSFSGYMIRKVSGIDLHHETGVVSLFPAPHIDLSSSAATMQLPNGVVTHNWTKEGGIQCAKGFRGERSHPDANSLILSCGSEGVIEEVLFASYGQPSGVQCGEYVQHSTCHHSRSVEVTEKKCLGRNECEVDLKEFLELECGDHMRAAVRCSNERKVLVSATIPIGTVAKIHIPQGTVLKGSDGKLFDGTSIELESGTSHFTLNDSH